MSVRLRRDREFEDGEIKSKLPTAEVPASRTVAVDGVALDPRVVDVRDSQDTDGDYTDQILCGNSMPALALLPKDSVACAITSPPYWNLVDYGVSAQIGGESYERYRGRLSVIWEQVERVLQPNGKFCLNVPLMPLRKAVSAEQFGKSHTRMILDLPGDLKSDILTNTSLRYYSLYIWEKQTTEKMFGSYPYPPNLLERNYCEFILVFVKPGKPPKMPKEVKEAAKLAQDEWMDLTKQIWWIYPENVKRKDGHPSPFPEALPNRLLRMYTFPTAGDFPGDIVLDPLCGWGTTCVAAKRQGRRYIGIDLNPAFCNEAVQRLEDVEVDMRTFSASKPTKT